jgi:hypothetical protein
LAGAGAFPRAGPARTIACFQHRQAAGNTSRRGEAPLILGLSPEHLAGLQQKGTIMKVVIPAVRLVKFALWVALVAAVVGFAAGQDDPVQTGTSSQAVSYPARG